MRGPDAIARRANDFPPRPDYWDGEPVGCAGHCAGRQHHAGEGLHSPALPPHGELRGGFDHFHVGHWQQNEVHAFYRAELVEEFRRKYSLLQRRAFASIS
jgi:hypothetical protein